jgi:hypothetical protein
LGVAVFRFIASGTAKECAPGQMFRQRYIRTNISLVETQFFQRRPDHRFWCEGQETVDLLWVVAPAVY